MTTQTNLNNAPINSPAPRFSYHHCQFPPTFTTLPAHIQYNSMLAYLQGPVGPPVCRTPVGFQQIPLPWLSDLTVGVELSSYLQSFTAAPFQLYSADWLR